MGNFRLLSCRTIRLDSVHRISPSDQAGHAGILLPVMGLQSYNDKVKYWPTWLLGSRQFSFLMIFFQLILKPWHKLAVWSQVYCFVCLFVSVLVAHLFFF
jgi:hypothetical protein